MVDPALEGLYPVKSLSRFADVIALCVQVMSTLFYRKFLFSKLPRNPCFGDLHELLSIIVAQAVGCS